MKLRRSRLALAAATAVMAAGSLVAVAGVDSWRRHAQIRPDHLFHP